MCHCRMRSRSHTGTDRYLTASFIYVSMLLYPAIPSLIVLFLSSFYLNTLFAQA